MDFGIAGKRALVTSSSKGLGAGIAHALASEGVAVTITGRDQTALAVCKAKIDALGKEAARTVVADLSTAEGQSRLKQECDDAGPIDILVNNTGGPAPKTASQVSSSDWLQSVDSMLVPVSELTEYVLVGMREREWGRVVTVASSGVVQPIPHLAISNAVRAAVAGWSKSLASEVAADGVTANVLLPGRIHTARVDQIDGAAAAKSGKPVEAIVADSIKTIPVGRYGSVEEFAAAAAFLCSQQAAYITGTMLRVDGGLIRSL